MALKKMTQSEKFPKEFRKGLRNFIVAYMVTDPPNLIDFGLQYFSKDVEMRQLTPESKRGSKELLRESMSVASVQLREASNTGHRQGVSSEIFDPEDIELEEKGSKVYKKTDAQIDHLTSTVKNVFAFQILDHHIMDRIVNHMVHLKVKKGEHVMEEGHNAERFFVIERGRFKEHSPKPKIEKSKSKEFKLMTDNGYFGQLSLHYHHIIPNTVVAESEGELWYIDRQIFRQLILKHSYAKTKQFSEICDEIVLLSKLSESAKMDLFDALEQQEYPSQTDIYKEGDEPKGMYFLQSGNVKTFNLDPKGAEINVRYYVKGDYFGEVEILEKKTRGCTAVTAGLVKTAFLPIIYFNRVLGNSRNQMQEKIVEYEHKVEYLHGVPDVAKETTLIIKAQIASSTNP